MSIEIMLDVCMYVLMFMALRMQWTWLNATRGHVLYVSNNMVDTKPTVLAKTIRFNH